jgi:hypothetical protein
MASPSTWRSARMPVTFTEESVTLHLSLTSVLCVCSISKDLVPFDVPVTFTIQVHDPMVDADGFRRYAQRLNSLTEAEFYTILAGIIHGQTRILAGGQSSLLFPLQRLWLASAALGTTSSPFI